MAHGRDDAWPALPLNAWQETCATLHMWSQVVGKVRLAKTPPVNHWWHVPLYLTSRGLTTSPIPDDNRTFEIDFDFIDHRIEIAASDGAVRELALRPISVADFHREMMTALVDLGVEVEIWPVPVEVPEPIPFMEDRVHAAYDATWANRFWLALAQGDRVFKGFRDNFLGKASPVHFFWGSFDLAVTLFSGRRAPERAGADRITREAYSHEVMSFGFWPGGGAVDDASFYAYAAPEPPGFAEARVIPAAARYHPELREFVLPYAAVRADPHPAERLLEFCESAYAAGAELGQWDRAALERSAESAGAPPPG